MIGTPPMMIPIVDLDDNRRLPIPCPINRARKASELHTKEKAQENDIVRQMYGIVAQAQVARSMIIVPNR